jgi:hypothetical protein
VDKLFGGAFGGDKIEPTARGKSFRVDVQYSDCDWVAIVKIVEQPSVQPFGFQFLLNFFDTHMFILFPNKKIQF